MFTPITPVPSYLPGILAAKAATHDLLDVAYDTYDSPVGTLLLAATPRGFVQVTYADLGAQEAVLDTLAARLSPRLLRAPGALYGVKEQLDGYFAGTRRTFELPLDWSLASGFRASTQQALTDIAYGTTISYGELAKRVGHPRATRAVGTACALNPLPIIVPCHRVVRADGSPGNYAGGAVAKRMLLALEAAGA